MARVTEPPRWLYGNVRAEETLNWLRNSCISCLTFSWRYAAQGITKRVTSCIASNSESCRLTGLNEPLVGMIGQNNWLTDWPAELVELDWMDSLVGLTGLNDWLAELIKLTGLNGFTGRAGWLTKLTELNGFTDRTDWTELIHCSDWLHWMTTDETGLNVFSGRTDWIEWIHWLSVGLTRLNGSLVGLIGWKDWLTGRLN